jgi:hypothetical protein
MSLGAVIVLILLERSRAPRCSRAGVDRCSSTEMLLLLGTLFCTVAGYFALQPMMAAARAGQGP